LSVNGTAEQKYVEISLITFPTTTKDILASEDELLPFAQAIADYWQPLKTWTPIALTLSQNGLSFTMVTAALLFATVIINIYEKRRGRNAKTRAYQKLSKTDQQLMDAIQKTEKPTLTSIGSTYESITHGKANPETLYQELERAERAGLISREIISQQDEPMQVWKTRFDSLQRRQ
jgi:hypothetical protein